MSGNQERADGSGAGRAVTISELHEWADKHAPDCTERRVLHLALERLLNFEAGQVPELKGEICGESRGYVCEVQAPIVNDAFDDAERIRRVNLIAASPVMLEALECLLPGLVLDLRHADDDDDKDAMRSRIKTVTDALAKATGQ